MAEGADSCELAYVSPDLSPDFSEVRTVDGHTVAGSLCAVVDSDTLHI